MPGPIIRLLTFFSPLFSRPTWNNLIILLQAHIFCRGRRTFTDLLRTVGLAKDSNFSRFYRIFSTARWSALSVSKILLSQLIKAFSNDDELIFIIDGTLERRRGPKIKGLGRHRDAVRSSKDRKVFSIGLHWLVTAIRIRIPWMERYVACPFLTVLLRPENPLKSSKNTSDLSNKKQHKKETRWTEQLISLLRRWLPEYKIVLVADSAYATYSICRTCIKRSVTLVSRLRADAKIFDFPPEKITRGRPRVVGKRQQPLKERMLNDDENWKSMMVSWYGGEKKEVVLLSETCIWYDYNSKNIPIPIRWVIVRNVKCHGQSVVLFSTDPTISVKKLIESYVSRWCLETTFQECRRHLGIETNRHWSDKAIDRITPTIYATYSLIYLMASVLRKEGEREIEPEQTAWYTKSKITFSDTLSYVRSCMLRENFLSGRSLGGNQRKVKRLERKFYLDTG